jgi:hypothetical protein
MSTTFACRDWTHTYRPVLAALQDFKDYGNGRGRAVCPCNHANGETSDLWLSVGDGGRLVIRCYPRRSGTPGCRKEDILARIGLSMSHLFPDWEEREREREDYKKRARTTPKKGSGDKMRDRPANEKSWTEAEHEYFDLTQEGKAFLSFVVVKKRYEGGAKDFPQKRPNPQFDPKKPASKDNPDFLWNLTGVRKVLYRLPELRAALRERRDRYVFVLEGEKDVDTARGKIGLTATTQPGGALKWNQDSYTDELAGCNVVLIPDEDPVVEDVNKPGTFLCPGIDHVRDVATKLLKKAGSVRLLRLPDAEPYGDLTDWYNRKLVECERANHQKAGSATFEPRSEIGKMLEGCQVIKSAEDIAKITPRGEPVWPIPPGQWAASVPKTAPPVPATAQPPAKAAPAPPAAPPAPIGNDGAVAALLATVADLKRAAPSPPRSAAEWAGEVWFAVSALQNSLPGLHGGDPATVRKAALYLAAQLLRGLDGIPDLRTGG